MDLWRVIKKNKAKHTYILEILTQQNKKGVYYESYFKVIMGMLFILYFLQN